MTRQRKLHLKNFNSLHSITVPKPLYILAVMTSAFLLMTACFLIFTPWIQTAYGEGHITTISPDDRPQDITAPLKGRIKKWYVTEGQQVSKGDLIAEIVDNDPHYMDRLDAEIASLEQKYQVAKIAAETANINFDRQQKLYKQGLSSRISFEKAKIDYNTYKAKEAAAKVKLINTETKRSRQGSQLVRAPADGMILQIKSSDQATFIKQGDFLAHFVPRAVIPIVELYVRGVDAPLIQPGAKVRMQFEGWPAVQFSGWPAVSVGSFGGVVISVDATVSSNGKFRVLVKQDPAEAWPNHNFLRYGARAKGWVLMERVTVGYELWRQLNSFPPVYPKNLKTNMMFEKHFKEQKNES